MIVATAKNRWWLPLLIGLLAGCAGCQNNQFLDSSIPGVVTPLPEIATVQTKWINGKLLQTTFLDAQNRVLEEFMYGRTSEKIENQYRAGKKIRRTHYYHSDSSAPGHVSITKSQFEYDARGRLSRVLSEETGGGSAGTSYLPRSFTCTYTYTGSGDTLIRQQPILLLSRSIVTDSTRRERNGRGQIVRLYHLYVLNIPQDVRLDTVTYFSRRFAYDRLGRRSRAWYDLMYLGQFYGVPGPDTVNYRYDRQNRLVGETHIYTLDRRNKREIDPTLLDPLTYVAVQSYRQSFFTDTPYSRKNQRVDRVEYRYEPFNPEKHLPLRVSQDVDYQRGGTKTKQSALKK